MSGVCVAVDRHRAYLKAWKTPMPEDALNSPLMTRPFLLVGAVAGVLIAAALVLWAHYGTAVFFEMIAAGIAACF
jgi:hypothetical protein